MAQTKKREFWHSDGPFSRGSPRPNYTPSVNNRADKSWMDNRGGDKAPMDGVQGNSSQEKLRALRNYRRARGLCDKCAEKWSYGHKCALTVQLHAIQEVWDLVLSGIYVKDTRGKVL